MNTLIRSDQKIPSEVAAVIAAYPANVQPGVMALRQLILEEAAALPARPEIEEALRWGQPAYLTPKGSTLRIGPHKDACFALFAHCQSTIIASYAQTFPGWDRLDGNRAVLFDSMDDIEPERLGHLIRHALTYHSRQS